MFWGGLGCFHGPQLYRSLEHFFPHVLDYFVHNEGLYITYHEII